MNRQTLGGFAMVGCVLLAATAVMAQPPGDRGRGGTGGPGGPGFSGGGVVGLIMRDEVQQELQLVDEQKDKLEAVGDRMRDEIREMFSGMRDLGEDERREQFRKKFETLNAEAETQLQKTLLPHQFERLKQIELQSRLRFGGSQALTSGALAEKLNLTDEQKEKIEKRYAEVQQEVQAQIRQIQADARKKILDVLTPEQRAQVEKMIGDQFDVEPRFDGNRFRGRGGDRGRERGENGRSSESRTRGANETI